MATSSIPTLKKNLYTQLIARAGLASVQVTYGAPFPMPEPEWIWLADVKGQQRAGAIGQQRREETYTLTVLIQVITAIDDSQETATERAFALMAEVEAQLRTDATVNGAVRTAEVEGGISLAEDAGAEYRKAQLIFEIACAKRI